MAEREVKFAPLSTGPILDRPKSEARNDSARFDDDEKGVISNEGGREMNFVNEPVHF